MLMRVKSVSELPQIQIDIGNSFCKVRCRLSGDVSEVVRVRDQDMWREDFFARFGVKINECDVLISNVAGENRLRGVRCLFEQENARSIFVASPIQSLRGLKLCYQDIAKIGVDRWLVMLAAKALFPSEGVCVVDFGTAITADFVANDGCHLGGYIAPGLRLLRKTLQVETAKVDFDPDQAGSELSLGQSTSECVDHGINGMIKGVVSLVEEKSAESDCARIVITGGDSTQYRRYFTLPVYMDSELIFKGLEIAHCYRDVCE